MFGRKEIPEAQILYPEVQLPNVMTFVEFEGASTTMDEETGKLEFTPRGKIVVQVSRIGAYYDHTIILFGNKVRVMETANQIALKILEATKR